jgi:integrase/recombinase XerD
LSSTPLKTSEAVEQFLLYLGTRKARSKSTIDTYRSALGFFVAFVGDCNIDDITISRIDNYADSLSVFNYGSKTLRNKLTPIRSLIKYLYSRDYTSIRPESIELPVVVEIEANFLEPDEQERLIRACRNPRERALILFLLDSGVRVSELVNARTSDLYERTLAVRKGKGGKPRATFITEEANEAINIYHSTLHPQTYLFPNAVGGQISRQYIARKVSEIAARACINKKVSPHTLRHTFATNLLRKGGRVEDVQPMMGHTNIRTTLIYTHFTNSYLHDRYDKIMEGKLS